jgi:hypothetical protein
MAPKVPFILPYETLEQQMHSIGIEFEDGTITVISGGMPYVFVREQGTESVTAQFPHLTAMGRWYLEDNTAGYIDIFTECRSMNYDRCLAIKYANFDPYDMEYRHGSFWTEPDGLLYSGYIFGDEESVPNRTIWFQLGTHSMEVKCFTSPLLSIAETTFIRTQN